MGTISLEGMEFFAHHGCYDEEQIIGTRFIVDLFIDYDTTEAENSDDLTQTVNYQSLYGLVKKEMATASKLLEHVARRILNHIAAEYPNVSATRIKISKINPPVGGKVGKVSIELRA